MGLMDSVSNVFNKVNGQATVDTGTFGKAVSGKLAAVMQQTTTGLLGGQIQQNLLGKELKKIQSAANQFGVDFPGVRNVLDSISQLTGIQLTGPNIAAFPNLIFSTVIASKTYKIFMYKSEDVLEFKDSIEWTEVDIMGRTSQVFNYKSTRSTEFSVTGYITVDKPDDVISWTINMQNIMAAKYPVNNDLGVLSPPIWSMLLLNPSSPTTEILFVKKYVRMVNIKYAFIEPFLVGNIPTVTKVTFDLIEVDDPMTTNYQVNYSGYVNGNYFVDYAHEDSKEDTPTNIKEKLTQDIISGLGLFS